MCFVFRNLYSFLNVIDLILQKEKAPTTKKQRKKAEQNKKSKSEKSENAVTEQQSKSPLICGLTDSGDDNSDVHSDATENYDIDDVDDGIAGALLEKKIDTNSTITENESPMADAHVVGSPHATDNTNKPEDPLICELSNKSEENIDSSEITLKRDTKHIVNKVKKNNCKKQRPTKEPKRKHIDITDKVIDGKITKKQRKRSKKLKPEE